MKALLRWGIGLLAVLLAFSESHGYDWVSPVTKCPLGFAPNLQTAQRYYFYGPDGRLNGPYYYLVPPFPPHRGYLPGPIGHALQSGCLSHELLMSKEAREMTLAGMPLLGKKKQEQDPPPTAPPGMGAMPPSPNLQLPQQGRPPMPPYPNYPMPIMVPGNMPAMMPNTQQTAYSPYGAPYGGMNSYAYAQRDPFTGIWQVQGVQPQPGFTPPAPQPYANPMMPRQGTPMMPGPMMPGAMMPAPMMAPPQPSFYFLNPSPGGFETFGQMATPPGPGYTPLNVPRPEFSPMDLPRMDSSGPPTARPQPNAYPTHPLIRSPRDFFMWGETMQEEKNRGNRPYPVP